MGMIVAPSRAKADAGIFFKEASLFMAGYGSGFVFHEMGHQAVADAKNIGIKWNIKPNIFRSEWKTEKKAVRSESVTEEGGWGEEFRRTRAERSGIFLKMGSR